MKPAADSRGSAAEMQSSFLMTNMAPQTPALNRGEWKGAEELVRAWSAQYGRVYVVMGPGQASRGTIAGGVRVPTHFWKAVLRYGADTSAVAFVFLRCAVCVLKISISLAVELLSGERVQSSASFP